MQTFELWDTATRNLVDSYDDMDSVVDALRVMTGLDTLALALRDEKGKTQWIARGAMALQRLISEPASA